MALEIDYGIQYREFHDDSDEHAAQMVRWQLMQWSAYLPAGKEYEALDIGCGMGFTMMALQQHGLRAVQGVDIDRSQVEAAQRRGLRVQQVPDLEAFLAAHRGRFGLITMFDVLEHIPIEQQIATVRGIHGALSPGGRLIVQVPNANAIMAMRWRYNDFTHHCSYTEHSLRVVLRWGGFSQVDVPPLDNMEPRPSMHPSKLFTQGNRDQFKRWLVRRLWRAVVAVEMGEESARRMPLGLNMIGLADKID